MSPGGDHGVVISARAAVGVPFSFVFCGDSYTPAGPDDPGIPRGGPDNEKKKKPEQKLESGERPDSSCNAGAGVLKRNEGEARDRKRATRRKENQN